MKILVLSFMYPNNLMYRSGIFVHQQVKALKKLGVNLTVISPVPYSLKFLGLFNKKWKNYLEFPLYEKYDGIDVYHTKFIAIPGGVLKDFWGFTYVNSLSKLIKQGVIPINEFDLIHGHGSLPDNHASYLLSKKYNIPYVLTVHGAEVSDDLKIKRHAKRIKFSTFHADAIIGISSKVVEKIKKYFKINKSVYLIHNGFTFDDNIKPVTNNDKTLRILFGASLIPLKGCDFLLRSFSRLSVKYPDCKLLIAGGGSEYTNLKKLSIDLGINEKTEFFNHVQHSYMLKLMSECDIFVLPSWNEGFGVVYLEAMSFKKPVIGVIGQGIEDIIKDGYNGLLVNPKDVESLTEKLEVLITDPKLRESLGIKGYESIKKLTWEKNAMETIKVYNSIARFNKITFDS